MDYADGRLLYLVLLLALLLFFATRGGFRLAGAVRALAIWGVILMAIALGYALVTG